MPQVLPGPSDTGLDLQRIKIPAPPSAPYVLTAVIVLPPESFRQQFAVRKAEDGGGLPTDWFYTETERIAKIDGRAYYEVKAYIDSGVATSFKIDRLDAAQRSALSYTKLDADGIQQNTPGAFVDAVCQSILWSNNQIRMDVFSPAGPGFPSSRIDSVALGSGYGLTQGPGDPSENLPEGRMWQFLNQPNGWYRRGKIIQTVFKHVPVRVGGVMGYMHVYATIFPWAEIQFDINWHTGGCEERSAGTAPPVGDPGDEFEITDPNDLITDLTAPLGNFGQSRTPHILFSHVLLEGLANLPPHSDPGFNEWVFTPAIQSGGSESDSTMRPSTRHIVRPVSDTDANRVHCMPVGFERPLRFAIHGDHVTPYTLHRYGVQDWSKPLGGWMFTPLGLPDLTALGAATAGMSLVSAGTNAKGKLRDLLPWKGDELGVQQGIVPGDPFWPGSWGKYGGETAGTGMTPFVGAKQAWTGEEDGLDILFVHQLRDRARTYGALYYNVSGVPVIPQLHAPGMNAPWDRFDRRFMPAGSGAWHDTPFRLASLQGPNIIHLSDYNPGPESGNRATPIDSQSQGGVSGFTLNRPDWYFPGTEGGAPAPADTLVVGYHFALGNFSQTLGGTPPPVDLLNLPNATSGDLAVPVLFYMSGASTFNNTKSITFRIVGTGEFDIEATEDVVFAGTASAPAVQAKVSLGKFKIVRSIEVVAVSGAPAATELITIGRQSVGIYEYTGSSGITALDDQHSVRYHAAMKALFLLTNNPLAFTYLMMDGQDARLVYWEGLGRAKKLSPVDNGAPGRGNVMPRNWAFAADRIATTIALSHGIANQATVDSFWESWRLAFRTNIVNSRMAANGLFQAPKDFKECAFIPFSAESFDFDGGNDSKFFHMIATRETSYFSYALLMMGSIHGHPDPELLDLCKGMAKGFQDLLWFVSGTVAQGPHTYLCVAYRTDPTQTIHPRTGALWNRIKRASEPLLASDVWTIFPDQAGLPEENPLSKVLINPASYPTPSVNRFAAAVAGNDAIFGGGLIGGAMTAMTLANNDANAAQQPVQVTLRVAGASFVSSKRRTFMITGTDPWGVPIDDDCLGAERAGDTFPPPQTHFVTVLGHSFPVASKLGITVLGGTTFNQFKEIRVTFVGTNSQGGALQETVTCRGQGTPKQFFPTNNYFKTVASIAVISTGNLLAATEKFRFGTRQTYQVVNGNGGATQDHRLWQAFKTVTEIIMLTNARATEHGFDNRGSLLVGETFAFGFQAVGLRQTIPGATFLGPDAFQTPYALACWKHLGAPEADELIKRYMRVDGSQGGADTVAAAKTKLAAWLEYGGGTDQGSVNPYVQWAPLLWTIRDA